MTAPRDSSVCLVIDSRGHQLSYATLDPDRAHEYARNIGGVVVELPTTADYRDQPNPAVSDPDAERAHLDSAMHSIWLHGNWHWLTRNMTTEEREAAAAAVERSWAADTMADGEPAPRVNLRWWAE